MTGLKPCATASQAIDTTSQTSRPCRGGARLLKRTMRAARITAQPATASLAWGRRDPGAACRIASPVAGRKMQLPASSSWFAEAVLCWLGSRVAGDRAEALCRRNNVAGDRAEALCHRVKKWLAEITWKSNHPRRQGDERGDGRPNDEAPLALPPLEGLFGSHFVPLDYRRFEGRALQVRVCATI